MLFLRQNDLLAVVITYDSLNGVIDRLLVDHIAKPILEYKAITKMLQGLINSLDPQTKKTDH